MLLDYLGILIDANATQHINIKINLCFIDDKPHLLIVKLGIVLYQVDTQDEQADTTITLPRVGLASLIYGDEIQEDLIKIEGNKEVFKKLLSYKTKCTPEFNIIEP